MSNETKSTLLDPVTPQNAVLLLVDQQEGLLARVYEPEQLRAHLLGLARGAKLLGVPVVMTTALSAGTNGPQWNALTTLFADEAIKRNVTVMMIAATLAGVVSVNEA